MFEVILSPEVQAFFAAADRPLAGQIIGKVAKQRANSMRLKVSMASANEQLVKLVTRGYELHSEMWNAYREKKTAGTFKDQVDRPRDGEQFNKWAQDVLDALGAIFPTDLEGHAFQNPDHPFGVVAEPDYEWKCMTKRLMEFIKGLDRIRIDSLPQYTDLPIKERLHVEDIDSFQKVRDVNPGMVTALLKDGYLDLAEDTIQLGLEGVLDVSFHKKDWGGEGNDLYTANLIVNGQRRPTAFLLKGNGLKKKVMEIRDCGKNGDQVLRLFQSPADLFVIQFVGVVSEAVIQHAISEIARLKSQGKEAHFLIVDGQDIARILLAYGKL